MPTKAEMLETLEELYHTVGQLLGYEEPEDEKDEKGEEDD